MNLGKVEQKKRPPSPSPASTPQNLKAPHYSEQKNTRALQNQAPEAKDNGPAQRLAYKTIRLLLQLPEKAQLIQIPEELRELNLTHTNLLISVLECLQNTPNISTAALLGHWHDTPEGSKLAGLAAQEFLLCNDSAELEINEAVQLLRKLHIAQAIQKQIMTDRESSSKDGAKLKALLELKKQLMNTEGGEK